jgi:Activator of Hsp90 ATPase homolog 1-like protein
MRYGRGVDGSEFQWARVLAFEPPDRLVFSWDLSPQWQIESDPEKTSEVEVRFIAESADRTRVELEHRNLDRHGDGWEGVRDAVAGDGGWPLYLGRYGELIAEEGRPRGSRRSARRRLPKRVDPALEPATLVDHQLRIAERVGEQGDPLIRGDHRDREVVGVASSHRPELPLGPLDRGPDQRRTRVGKPVLAFVELRAQGSVGAPMART